MNRVCSIFSQLLRLFPRSEFEELVRKQRAERNAKGFSCWGQFIAMLFCQLGQAKSLREIHEGLRASEGKLRHLGLRSAPARSTLAYANEHRPWQLFEQLFHGLWVRCRAQLAPGCKDGLLQKLPGKLYSLDATVIDLCAQVFDWAKFQSTKGAVKLHLLLDHDGYLPGYAVITEGKVHEIHMARRLKLPAGSVLVFDRGYTDYDWFAELQREGVFFVSRLKENADWIVVERREVSPAQRQAKALKQNLRIKTFVGTSARAPKIQIWTALIAILVLKYLQLRSRFGWSLSRLVALLRQQLFVYRDLWTWIDCPFEPPPPLAEQAVAQVAFVW